MAFWIMGQIQDKQGTTVLLKQLEKQKHRQLGLKGIETITNIKTLLHSQFSKSRKQTQKSAHVPTGVISPEVAKEVDKERIYQRIQPKAIEITDWEVKPRENQRLIDNGIAKTKKTVKHSFHGMLTHFDDK